MFKKKQGKMLISNVLIKHQLRKDKNMYRDHNCGELNIKNVKQEVNIAGWVQKIRFNGIYRFKRPIWNYPNCYICR